MLDVEQLIKDVNKQGYNIKTYQDLYKLKSKDKNLIPILLKYLGSVDKVNEKLFFVSCLGVKGFYDATEALLREFLSSNDRSYKWAIGNSLSIILDKSTLNDLIKIVINKEHGTSRQMIIVALGLFKDKKAIPFLLDLLDDEDVKGHVIMALSKFKDPELIPYIKPFVNHNITWVRNEAKKTIDKLEKLQNDK
ncbi:HEAT repeat domain-containing protein [Litchfieldia salsa]|uniref:HEAT repeat-containing protein n=1 Tax=Litchfieldia salsa TaxID=930152 RepID=A0A1H0SP34_9BACI|nr:HEAT repeat domain-containing protein [Litchfieldia salsa]SDP43524.1 HEAT repeat-containing protein [Litchfieldia salsa]